MADLKYPAAPKGSCCFCRFAFFVSFLKKHGALEIELDEVQIKSSFAVASRGKFSILGLCVNTDEHLLSIPTVDPTGVLLVLHFTWSTVWMSSISVILAFASQISLKASLHVSQNPKTKDTACFFCYHGPRNNMFSIAALLFSDVR